MQMPLFSGREKEITSFQQWDYTISGLPGGKEEATTPPHSTAAETAPLSVASYSSLPARHLTSSRARGAAVAEETAPVTVAAAAALLIRALCCLPRAEAAALVFFTAPGPRESALAA